MLSQGPVIIASSQGGVNIEDVAKENPEAIVTEPIDISKGILKEQAESVAQKLGFHPDAIPQTVDIITKLYNVFIQKDASMVEINPMVEDASGKVYCLDAKCRFDDNADFRQKDVFDKKDWSQG